LFTGVIKQIKKGRNNIKMLKAYKYRIYPNKEQREFFSKTFGCVRFIYNKMLYDKIEHYKENKEMLRNTPAQYKSEYPWLKEVDSLGLSNAQLNLESSFRSFYRGQRKGIKGNSDKHEFPKYKSKKSNYHSYTTNNQNGTIAITENKLKLPKISGIRIKKHREFEGRIKSATISITPGNKYYASLLVETEIKPFIKKDTKIGIDIGIKEFASTSDGCVYENPKWLNKNIQRLRFLQKSLSRKKKGSKNRRKARIKVAKLHEKIKNMRSDFLHKLSCNLLCENQVIVLEDLKVKNMQKNHKLARAISDVSWFEFRRMVEYKAKWYGRDIIIAPSNYASSQLCSECGYRNKKVKDLSVRNWDCPLCNLNHDRDINAARNLLKLAL
jgi:putative transposase